MPGGTGHAAGAGPQAKESGSDFRRRNPEAMFVTKDFPLDSGDTSSGTQNWVPIWFWFSLFRGQDGDFFRRQRQLPSCRDPDCRGALFVCVRCVCACVCDRYRGPPLSTPPACSLAVGPTLPSPGLIWSRGWKVGSLGQWLPASHRGPGARPRPSCACSYLGHCGKERSEGPGPLPGAWPTCTAWEGRGSRSAWSPVTEREWSPRFARTLSQMREHCALRRARPLDSCLMLFLGQVP